MNSSLDPQTPRAPVSQIGPSRDPYQPRFSDLLRTKWNQAVERGVDSVRSTDWTSVGAGIAEGGRGVVRKISGEVKDAKPAMERAERQAEGGGRRILRDLQREAGDVAHETEEVSENIFERVKSAVNTARETTAAAAQDATRTMGRAMTEIKEDSVDLAHLAKDKVEERAQEAKRVAEVQKKQREEYHEGILAGSSGVGVVSAAAEDLSKESFTGGAAMKVRAKRQAEGTLASRLV